jgi:hypothetical protein
MPDITIMHLLLPEQAIAPAAALGLASQCGRYKLIPPQRLHLRHCWWLRIGLIMACYTLQDMNKRNIMNLILLGGAALPAAGLAGPYALFFVPKRCDCLHGQQGCISRQCQWTCAEVVKNYCTISSGGSSSKLRKLRQWLLLGAGWQNQLQSMDQGILTQESCFRVIAR